MAEASTPTEDKTAAKPAAKSAAKPRTTKAAAAKAASKSATAAKSASTKPAARKATKAAPKSARATPAARKTSASGKARDTAKTAREHDNHADRAWSLAEKIGIAMFVTWDGERQRSRPLGAKVDKDEGAIYFLTDIAGEKDDQIAEYPFVSVNFADNRKARYVVFSGKATVSNDRERIKEMWSPFAKAWWDSPEDPNIRVIRMVPEDAELWDSPGKIVSTVSILAAAVTGKAPKVGENAKIVLQ